MRWVGVVRQTYLEATRVGVGSGLVQLAIVLATALAVPTPSGLAMHMGCWL